MTVAHAVPHRFTVDDYHRMAADGILRPDERVELIQGEVVEMTPIGSRHAAVVNQLNGMLVRAANEQVVVSVQNPIHLSMHDEPEPDLALLEPRQDRYSQALPGADAVLLVVEVADSSLPYDRDTKLPLYARSGIPEVWLVNLAENGVEIYSEPMEGGYRRNEHAAVGETIEVAALAGTCLAVAEILLVRV